MGNVKKQQQKQRMDEQSGINALADLTQNFKDKLQSATTYAEDYAGGTQEFINKDIVMQLIKKLTR